MSNKKALVLVFNILKHDARVIRQIGFLENDFEVTVAAFENGSFGKYHFFQLEPINLSLLRKLMIAVWSLLGNYTRAWETFHPYFNILKQLSKEKWDLILSNDVETLPLAFSIKRNQSSAKIVLDAHEYSPRHFEDRWWWRLIFQPMNIWCCTEFIPRLDGMFTVGQGLANEYASNFNRRPIVLTNAPAFQKIEPSPLTDNKIRLVHHGIANPSRRPDLMLELMQHLDPRFTLDLYLMTSGYASEKTKKYISELKKKFTSDSRIRVYDPLPQNQIVTTLNHYDIGLFLLPPINFNYANALPNKFFDFIQARLAVAIGPSPEMAGIIKKYENGIVAEDFNPITLAKKINALNSSEVFKLKQQSNLAAHELCAEKNAVIFNKSIKGIF